MSKTNREWADKIVTEEWFSDNTFGDELRHRFTEALDKAEARGAKKARPCCEHEAPPFSSDGWWLTDEGIVYKPKTTHKTEFHVAMEEEATKQIVELEIALDEEKQWRNIEVKRKENVIKALEMVQETNAKLTDDLASAAEEIYSTRQFCKRQIDKLNAERPKPPQFDAQKMRTLISDYGEEKKRDGLGLNERGEIDWSKSYRLYREILTELGIGE